MPRIQNFLSHFDARSVSIETEHKLEVFGMKSDDRFCPGKDEQGNEVTAPPSRFIDEKISDESGTESNSDSAMKPAGLINPFWN